MLSAEYYVNICEPFGYGGHIYYFQTNCRGGPRLIYYLKLYNLRVYLRVAAKLTFSYRRRQILPDARGR